MRALAAKLRQQSPLHLHPNSRKFNTSVILVLQLSLLLGNVQSVPVIATMTAIVKMDWFDSKDPITIQMYLDVSGVLMVLVS